MSEKKVSLQLDIHLLPAKQGFQAKIPTMDPTWAIL